MSTVDPRKKLQKLIESLELEVQSACLEEQIDFASTADPYINIHSAFQKLVSLAVVTESNPKLDDSQLLKSNEGVVLECFKYLVGVNVELGNFSKMLYQGQYPRELFKAYRQLYEGISLVSNCLFQFDSENEEFLREKEDLVTENLQLCEQIQKGGYKDKKNTELGQQEETEETNNLIASLKKQIENLNELIAQNEDQFAVEIQRYNNTLFDMQQTIREYEMRMDKTREYQNIIDDLEHKLIRRKQEKYRDDMLIDNMSKKIRIYEKERGSIDAFLSPRAGLSRKNMGSLINNRPFLCNHSLLGTAETRFKNGFMRE